MPRPVKSRMICSMPKNNSFGPMNCRNNEIIKMTLEEFESIRLIDKEGLTQEEASNFMGVARTTIQKIYDIARGKIADSIVNGKKLIIEGGNYRLCSNMGFDKGCNRGNCRRMNQYEETKEDKNEE